MSNVDGTFKFDVWVTWWVSGYHPQGCKSPWELKDYMKFDEYTYWSNISYKESIGTYLEENVSQNNEP